MPGLAAEGATPAFVFAASLAAREIFSDTLVRREPALHERPI